MKWQTFYNPHTYAGSFNDQPSMTVPDMAQSLQEILRRHSLGLPLNTTSRIPLFSEDPENDLMQGVNPATLDLVELQNLRNFAAERVVALQKQADDNVAKATTKKAAKEAAKKQELFTEVQKHLDSSNKDATPTK